MATEKNISARVSSQELESFFSSAGIRKLKADICDIGRRMWQREYVDGNGGNICIKVAPDLVLCTPTLVSKGFMKPEDLCLVNLEGKRLAGRTQRTSEILMHIEIMKRQPRAIATVHGHPPLGTAFGLVDLDPPQGLLSEYELFVSAVIAPYRTPGTSALGEVVAELADRHNTIIMSNHGVVCWSHLNVEDAYFKMEILEAHCRTLMAAWQLQKPLKKMTPRQIQDLLAIKKHFGYPDPRLNA